MPPSSSSPRSQWSRTHRHSRAARLRSRSRRWPPPVARSPPRHHGGAVADHTTHEDRAAEGDRRPDDSVGWQDRGHLLIGEPEQPEQVEVPTARARVGQQAAASHGNFGHELSGQLVQEPAVGRADHTVGSHVAPQPSQLHHGMSRAQRQAGPLADEVLMFTQIPRAPSRHAGPGRRSGSTGVGPTSVPGQDALALRGQRDDIDWHTGFGHWRRAPRARSRREGHADPARPGHPADGADPCFVPMSPARPRRRRRRRPKRP